MFSSRRRLPSWLAAVILTLCFHAVTKAQTRPNVLFILADDVGVGDLSCYGATQIQTPNIDRIAKAGMRFRSAYSPGAMCSPTRYSIMTGEYPWRNPAVARGVLSGVSPLCIRPDQFTLPRMMRTAGYQTGGVGKWHLGLGKDTTDYNARLTPGTQDVGFDYFFGIPATNDRTPCVYFENDRVVGLDAKDPIRVAYKEEIDPNTFAKNPKTPLNMYPSHGHDQTIHNGVSRIGQMLGGQAARWKDEDMADTFVAKARGFMESANKAGKPFFLYFASVDIHVPRIVHPRFAGKSPLGPRGDALLQLDATVGELLKSLDDLGVTKNTLVIFTSDNGGVLDDGYKDQVIEKLGSHKVNGELRGFKAGLYEGGSRVPMLVSYPGEIDPGVTHDGIITSMDTIATLAGILNVPLPAGAAKDSLDQSDVIEENAGSVRENMVLLGGNGGLAIRSERWKLIPASAFPKKKNNEPELYNLIDDPGETKNLAKEQALRVKELEALLEKIKSK